MSGIHSPLAMAKSSGKKRYRKVCEEDLPSKTEVSTDVPGGSFLRRFATGTFGLAAIGTLLFWASLPQWGWPAPEWWPLSWWPLALTRGWWPLVLVAPVSWIVLIRREQLSGKRPYRAIWLASFLFWLNVIHWMCMPHPATSLGWSSASVYLALYLPVFVGLSRIAVHRLGISVVVAAPVVWMGLQLIRSHIVGGFAMASLGHPLYHWPAMIQTADLAGAYGVGFVVMFLAACLGRLIPVGETHRQAYWPALAGLLMLAAVLSYGYVRMAQANTEPAARVALIQGSTDITLNPDPGRGARMHQQHLELSREAVSQDPDIDLVVWPETVFGADLMTREPEVKVPEWWNGTPEEFQQRLDAGVEHSQDYLGEAARDLGAAILVGITRRHYSPRGEAIYNSAAFAHASGEFGGFYDKIHLVMFGEYFPFAEELSFLYDFTPVNTMGLGLQRGDKPVVFDLNGLSLAPNICYESVTPQVIHREVTEPAARGHEPDVLVNLTNDGWFFGSNELDLHLICGVFRAVECRKPFLIAANTGISAWIDGNGQIRKQAPRRTTAVIIADVAKDGRKSLYLLWGDLPAGICLACCVALALFGWVDRRKESSDNKPQAPDHRSNLPAQSS